MAAALPRLQTLCHGCLSADRDLSPIGEFVSIYRRICNDKTTLDIKDASLCWECTATLKRTHLFYTQVNKARTILKFYIHTKDLQKSLPKSLSKLEITNTNHDYIGFTETEKVEPDIKFVNSAGPGYQISLSKLDKIKREASHNNVQDDVDDVIDDENELDDEIDDLNVKDDEKDDVKRDPSYIVDYKNKTKSRKANVNAHYKRAQTEFLCDHCGTKKPTKISIERHITRHHMDNKCEYCSRTFRDYYRLNAHIAYVHSKCNKRELEMQYCHISTAEEMCVKEQARPSDLVDLWERDGCISQGDDTISTEQCSKNENTAIQKSDDPNELKPYTCKICYARYPTLEELSSHMMSHEVYRCLVCGHRSPSLEAAGRHVTRHRKIIKCLLCEYCCRKKRDVIAHYTIAHTEFSCEHCKKKKPSKISLERHITRHHMANKCKYCSLTFRDYYKLNAHIARMHSKHSKSRRNKTELEMQYCRISTAEEMCVKEQARPSDLSSHETTHEVYRCLVCGHRSPSVEAAGRHVTRHGEVIKCRLCEYCCGKIRDVEAHYEIAHTEFLCDYCKKKHKTKSTIELHITRHHMDNKCPQCSSKLRNYQQLRGHIARVHGETGAAFCVPCNKQFKNHIKYKCHLKYSIAHLEQHQTKRYKCDQCPKSYPFKGSLNRHIEKVHQMHETEETFCATCHIQCENKMRFKNHLRTRAHKTKSGLKVERFKCPECDKSYTTKLRLLEHIDVEHLGIRTYYCKDCDKVFKEASKLKLHIRYTHEGVRKRKDKLCSVCGRGFTTNEILKLHMRTHTGERPYACAVCGARFAQGSARDVHQKRHGAKNNRVDRKRGIAVDDDDDDSSSE